MKPEVWLRGPLPGVSPLLQPAAHAIAQCREELQSLCADLTADELRARPGGAASILFHLVHLAGSTDRLCTYARGESLSAAQLAALTAERAPEGLTPAAAWALADRELERAADQIAATGEASLTVQRSVGRAQLPSTIHGLLFHVAEHAQRHAGQIATTKRFVRGGALDRNA